MERRSAEAGPSRLISASTVQATPPATPTSTKSAKRRSWFGFGSPAVDSPTRSTRKGSKGPEEGLELVEANVGAGTSNVGETPRRSEEVLEDLTIDGEVEETVRKKKGKRRSLKESEGSGEVVRMADLSLSKGSGEASRRKAYDPGGVGDTPNLFSPRSFARTASDRDAFSPPSAFKTPPLPIDAEQSTPRASSSSSNAERPLPPLPPTDDKALPDVPRGIVVTPSSPRKLSKRNRKASSSNLRSESDRRSRSASRESRDSTQSRKIRNVRSFNLGLGLPLNRTDDAPPVPIKAQSKAQSVSSPLPSRGPSPTPRIVFAEPDAVEREKDKEKDAHSTESEKTEKQRGRGKRARSLSGMLSKPPQLESRPNSRPTTPDPETDEVTVKASGVLGWLGVKKTVKRRTSETKLKTLRTEESKQAVLPPSADRPLELRGGMESRESLQSVASGEGTVKTRPEYGTQGSSVTVVPDSSNRRSIFRRSSSRGSGTSPHVRPADSRPIPILSHSDRRTSTADSSRSSLNLPRAQASPGLQNEAWPPSPNEIEETLFSPDSGSHWGPGVRPWMEAGDGRRSNRSSVSQPLGSLPEQGSLATVQPSVPPVTQGNRLRSWSDAPLPGAGVRPANNSSPHLPTDSPVSTSLQAQSAVPTRPKLPGRSSSGNSVIIGRMRTVFAKTTSRGRSQTLLRQPSSEADEFGVARSRQEWQAGTTMRPTSTVSSDAASTQGGSITSPQTALLGLSNAERSIFLNDPPERSPRTSIAGASISSVATGSTRHSTLMEPSRSRTGRARASTMFSGSSSHFGPPPSPQIFPVAATPPRRRPSVIQRLSSGVMRTGPSSPRGNSLFPLPPRSSGSLSSNLTSPLGADDTASSATSPRPSAGSITAAMGTTSLKAIAARDEDESPKVWLERVSAKIGREEIANVLAASGDEFHTTALKLFMSRFDFTHNALDVALRRLLMEMSLPRETQQIDRIIEAFAVRYEECEPGLFMNKDNTYVLAFSMMMLHTDAFNRHNKNKMTKTDYVRNTRMDGVSPLVLEAFFDNITFTPFVFIEDESDLFRSTDPPSASTFTTTTSSQLTAVSKNGKVDVYHMIVRDQLGSLRIDMEDDIPATSPYSCLGTRPLLDTEILHRAFAQARNLIIVPPKRKTSAAGLLGSTPSKVLTPAEQEVILKVTKVGLLSRRDESGEGTKKSRKWKSWSVILTGSQLLFFKDPVWALTLLEQMQSPTVDKESGQPLLPKMTNFKPDEVFPVKDCVAVYDRSYRQYPNTFRFVMPSHRQYSLQAADEYEMNEWINLINYATAFKTSGVRMRGMAMGKDRAVLAGAAAAASHKRELEAIPRKKESAPKTPRKAVFGESDQAAQGPLNAPPGQSLPPLTPRKGAGAGLAGRVDVDEANDVVNEGEQLEEVFDVVKAELAAGRGGAKQSISSLSDAPEGPANAGQRAKKHGADGALSRGDRVQAQLRFFEDKVTTTKTTLSGTLQTARNLAILTPFQKATRDRIASAVPALASKIRHIRLDIAKLELWIEMLRRDLVYEQREMARLRHVALQAAAKSLRDPLGVHGVVQDVNAGEEREVPVLALPDGHEDPAGDGEEGEGEGRRRSDDSGMSGMSGTSANNRFGTSPGELPVIIRQSSDEPIKRSNKRPGVGRQTSAQSYRSSTSNSDLRRIGSDLLYVTGSGAGAGEAGRPETPREESPHGTGRSTPVLFNLSDVEDERTVLGHTDGTRAAGEKGLGIDLKRGETVRANGHGHGHGQKQDQGERCTLGNGIGNGRDDLDDQQGPALARAKEHRAAEEQAEEWMKTRAARRVSLANIPDLQRLQSPQGERKTKDRSQAEEGREA